MSEDTISRKAAIDAFYEMASDIDHLCTVGDYVHVLEMLPSAQPEKHTENTRKTHACDLIDRQAAISAMEDVDWYHIDKDGQLVHGANSKEDEPLYKASDVYAVLNQMPSAQPEWNNHTVACLLAEIFGDNCACNFNGIDKWLPEKCEVIDSCPNPVGVACWEQYLTHRAERRTDE